MITEFNWAAKGQKGEGTVRIRDMGHLDNVCALREQTILFSCDRYRPWTMVSLFIFIISFDHHTVCEEKTMSLPGCVNELPKLHG